MRVLVLDEEFPYPANSGKRTRSFNLYSRLAARFHIRYIGYGEDGSPAAAALRRAGIEPVAVRPSVPPKHGIAFYLRLLANLLSPLPYIVTSHYSKAYRDVLLEQLDRFRPSLIVCEWTPYAIFVRGLSPVAKVVSAHNVEADIWQRYHETEANWLKRWYIGEQWRKVRKFESAALRWVEGALAVSEQDRARLAASRPGLRSAVIPNGVDVAYFRPAPQPADRQQLVFTGSMDWRPNQDAARYFARAILPLLRQASPSIECTFVGRDPPADVRALAAIAGMRITGTVDDVRPYVERAAVYVVPLRVGGGSRLKILEAMAMGRAVVSTRVGAEGLDVVHDRHVLLADDPREFAESVLQLLGDPGRCARLAEEGRRLVEQQYEWGALSERLGEFVRLIATNEAGSAQRI